MNKLNNVNPKIVELARNDPTVLSLLKLYDINQSMTYTELLENLVMILGQEKQHLQHEHKRAVELSAKGPVIMLSKVNQSRRN